MTKLYLCICFFTDIVGGAHFEVSARAYTLASCEEFAQGYISEKYEDKEAGVILDAWVKCVPIPGFAI